MNRFVILALVALIPLAGCLQQAPGTTVAPPGQPDEALDAAAANRMVLIETDLHVEYAHIVAGATLFAAEMEADVTLPEPKPLRGTLVATWTPVQPLAESILLYIVEKEGRDYVAVSGGSPLTLAIEGSFFADESQYTMGFYPDDPSILANQDIHLALTLEYPPTPYQEPEDAGPAETIVVQAEGSCVACFPVMNYDRRPALIEIERGRPDAATLTATWEPTTPAGATLTFWIYRGDPADRFEATGSTPLTVDVPPEYLMEPGTLSVDAYAPPGSTMIQQTVHYELTLEYR